MAKPQIIAHRGAWKKASLPQNSMAALENAKKLHCDGVELDVHLTADGVVVVNHDADFYRLPIEQSTYAALCSLQHPNGEKIPRLEDFLLLAQKLDIPLFLEIKASVVSAKRSLELTEKVLGIVNQCWVQPLIHYISFDKHVMRKIRSLELAAIASYLTGDLNPAQVKARGWQGIDYHTHIYRGHPQWLFQARELGLLTNAWTVNDADDMRWFLRAGIDFISTDEPEMWLRAIR